MGKFCYGHNQMPKYTQQYVLEIVDKLTQHLEKYGVTLWAEKFSRYGDQLRSIQENDVDSLHDVASQIKKGCFTGTMGSLGDLAISRANEHHVVYERDAKRANKVLLELSGELYFATYSLLGLDPYPYYID